MGLKRNLSESRERQKPKEILIQRRDRRFLCFIIKIGTQPDFGKAALQTNRPNPAEVSDKWNVAMDCGIFELGPDRYQDRKSGFNRGSL